MNVNHDLFQKQLQQLVLTPELQQSLLILQMPNAELETYFSGQIVENCVLEVANQVSPDNANNDDTDLEQPGIADRETMFSAVPDFEEDDLIHREKDYIENIRSDNGRLYGKTASNETPSLQEYLLFQLHLADLSPRKVCIGEFLIGNIDEDGYLKCSYDEAASLLRVPLSEIVELIERIHTFDPPGVCSLNLAECLRLQLEADHNNWIAVAGAELYAATLQVIEKHLPNIAAGKLAQIAAETGHPLAVVQRATAIIKKLTPQPGRNFGNAPHPSFLIPDIIVKKDGAGYQVSITESTVTRLYINPLYIRILNTAPENPETTQYIKDKLQAAVWLLKCLERRKNTLLKIGHALVERQKEFFDKGLLYLTPLTLRDIAAELAIHESTVSRAIQGKYIETPQGAYPLKFFFHRKMNTSQGDPISSESIKKLIGEMIRNEDKKRPLSDQQIAALLKTRGITASRRTVTNYREELRIPPSGQRRHKDF